MKTEFTVDYFIAKFEAIPESAWCTEELYDGDGRHCAYGHCRVDRFGEPTVESEALGALFGLREYLFHVNDGYDCNYQQPTPKQRILAALQDIKSKQQGSEHLGDAIPYLRGDVEVKKEIHYVKLEVELTEANPN